MKSDAAPKAQRYMAASVESTAILNTGSNVDTKRVTATKCKLLSDNDYNDTG